MTKDLIEDLRLNHEYCPQEVILQAADILEKALETLQLIADIASGSRTANSLPNIERIAKEALKQLITEETT